jgi:hypothetical protein
MLTESLLIALIGGGLGAVLAEVGVRALVSLLPAGFPRAHDIHVNTWVFAFTLLVVGQFGFPQGRFGIPIREIMFP